MASLGNQLAQGKHSASLDDYRTIREKEKVRFPKDILEVGITLSRYAVLCQALFQGTGPVHPLVETLWALTASLNNSVTFIAERYQQLVHVPAVSQIYFAAVVRSVQVSVHEYLHGVSTNVVKGHAGVDLPDFRALVTDLKRGTFHQSANWVPLPAEYVDPPRSISLSGGTSQTPSATPTGASSVLTARTGVSTLTADTPRYKPCA